VIAKGSGKQSSPTTTRKVHHRAGTFVDVKFSFSPLRMRKHHETQLD